MGSHLAGPRIRPGLLTTLSGLCVAGTAAGVLTARLRRRLMTADVLSRTGLTLGSVADVSELRAALASALGDETLDIHLSSVDHGPARIDDRRPDGTRRRRVEVTDGGRRVAALSFDAALAGDDGLLAVIATQTRDALWRIRATEELERSRRSARRRCRRRARAHRA